MSSPRLKDDVKVFIIQGLACFDGLAAVGAAVKKEFGVEVSRQLVESHDPTKKAGSSLGERWRTLFDETRKTFIESTVDIGISHRTVRLRVLSRMAAKAEDQGNMVLAASLLEQAAKEMGGSFTNKTQVGVSFNQETALDELE